MRFNVAQAGGRQKIYLVHLYLPLRDNAGVSFPEENYAAIKRELATRFGGLTAFTRSPAEGLWKPDRQRAVKEDVVVFEVLAEQPDQEWWRDYRVKLEKLFRQDKVLIIAHACNVL